MADQGQPLASTGRKRGRPSTSAQINSHVPVEPTSTTSSSNAVGPPSRTTSWRQTLTDSQRVAHNSRRRNLRQNQQSNLPNHATNESTSTCVPLQDDRQDVPIEPQHQLTTDVVPNLRAPLRNSARINQVTTVRRLELPPTTFCRHCNAKLFYKETNNLCCNNGKAILPVIPVPPELLDLFCQQGAVGRHFRQNIRAYNHVFAFTSMGVTLDESTPSFEHGIYAFRAHGALYHRIGALLPTTGNRPRFLQMFIYDTESEIEHRMEEGHGLNVDILQTIKRLLDMYNPFVHTFRQISDLPQIHSCKLIILDRPASDRQYIHPTASQVAAVLVGADDFMESNDRDVLVCTSTGDLVTVKEYAGYYDPMPSMYRT